MAHLTAREIIATTASDHGLTVDDLVGKVRTRHISAARFEAMARIRAERKLSLPAIGRLFNRDHTTVLHALKAYSAGRLPDAPRPRTPPHLPRDPQRAP